MCWGKERFREKGGKKVAGDLEAVQTYNIFGNFLLDIITTYISPSRSSLKPSRSQNLRDSSATRLVSGQAWNRGVLENQGRRKALDLRYMRIDIGVNRRPSHSEFCLFFVVFFCFFCFVDTEARNRLGQITNLRYPSTEMNFMSRYLVAISEKYHAGVFYSVLNLVCRST